VVVDKVKLALVLLVLGLVIGICLGYGMIPRPYNTLVFDLMMSLTFIYVCIWTIRKRHAHEENEKDQLRE